MHCKYKPYSICFETKTDCQKGKLLKTKSNTIISVILYRIVQQAVMIGPHHGAPFYVRQSVV